MSAHPQRRLIERALVSLLRISRAETGYSEWKLISGCLGDLEEALEVFHPWRNARKICVFGSARAQQPDPIYALAQAVAREAVAAGFSVLTGAGGGVMEAANAGAGCENSIGLNVDLPFEQHPNRYVSSCEGRLLHFRYFFTRKLFFLRESDAVVVLPGGFGTLDELFESLTLTQTGRTPPIPLVLLAPPGDDFWSGWLVEINGFLAQRGLISPEDGGLVMVASSAVEAVARIGRFYRVFHSAQLAEDRVELLLNTPLPEPTVQELNHRFDDLIEQGVMRVAESCDEGGILRPALRFRFDKRRMGRLYQLIDHLNALELPGCAGPDQPCDPLSGPLSGPPSGPPP
jgi:uncharacterized protein (TIGR00730 family)